MKLTNDNKLQTGKTKRFETKTVQCGNIVIGGDNPVRVQTMTNTSTSDIEATVEQCIRTIEAGSELVRITTPTLKDVDFLAEVKQQLRSKGYETPLIADVHFNPAVAEKAARIVEKVRINPGNYIDKKTFKQIDYTDEEYNIELEKIRERILPLLEICKTHKTAIRIGTNHGSLSDRIVSRYGDTANGMVESTLEFLRICKEADFHNIIISLKSSNTRVMIYANRLLAEKMQEEELNYPIHLGVTEAGEGEDGRIKSVIGIATLLSEGIGDTIRVSLTEVPENEIPVAQKIVDLFADKNYYESDFNTSCQYKRRVSNHVENIGKDNVPVVISDFPDLESDYYFEDNRIISSNNPIQNYSLIKIADFPKIEKRKEDIQFVLCNKNIGQKLLEQFKDNYKTIFIFENNERYPKAEFQKFLKKIQTLKILQPVILKQSYSETNISDFQLKAAGDIGSLFVDGLCDGIWLRNNGDKESAVDSKIVVSTAFGILQASRTRMSKTEYISCPSCGRTLFNLEQTTAVVKKYTSHLKHLKIGIMGCIVNGPGEMADADYGYVGSGKGKISLYKGQNLVKRNIDETVAVEELINLIKQNGDWCD